MSPPKSRNARIHSKLCHRACPTSVHSWILRRPIGLHGIRSAARRRVWTVYGKTSQARRARTMSCVVPEQIWKRKVGGTSVELMAHLLRLASQSCLLDLAFQELVHIQSLHR